MDLGCQKELVFRGLFGSNCQHVVLAHRPSLTINQHFLASTSVCAPERLQKLVTLVDDR